MSGVSYNSPRSPFLYDDFMLSGPTGVNEAPSFQRHLNSPSDYLGLSASTEDIRLNEAPNFPRHLNYLDEGFRLSVSTDAERRLNEHFVSPGATLYSPSANPWLVPRIDDPNLQFTDDPNLEAIIVANLRDIIHGPNMQDMIDAHVQNTNANSQYIDDANLQEIIDANTAEFFGGFHAPPTQGKIRLITLFYLKLV